MTDDRASGLALIAGSCGFIITLSLHPTGHIPTAQLTSIIPMLIGVHALALACVPVLFLGAWGLSRRLSSPDRLTVIGLVLYTFALLAIADAAVADGLVTPGVLRQVVQSAAAPGMPDPWRMIARYNFFVNQAYAQVYVASSAVAIALWSVAILRQRTIARVLGMYGCILAVATLAALFSGHLRLDTHGMGVVALAQSLWFVIAGSMLWRAQSQATAS